MKKCTIHWVDYYRIMNRVSFKKFFLSIVKIKLMLNVHVLITLSNTIYMCVHSLKLSFICVRVWLKCFYSICVICYSVRVISMLQQYSRFVSTLRLDLTFFSPECSMRACELGFCNVWGSWFCASKICNVKVDYFNNIYPIYEWCVVMWSVENIIKIGCNNHLIAIIKFWTIIYHSDSIQHGDLLNFL